MNKDLIISSDRHETKVAIVEDEQLVEIFFQRANEYSLVGSIHKGRVTRVLPGMQSAFVDVGLERDAFLYVSDFFEDSDEYEPIAETVGKKPARGGRNRAPSSDSSSPPHRAETEPNAKRGRRSRRRRSRGRGFPESKYAAEASPDESPAAADSVERRADEPPEKPETRPGEA